MTPPTTTDTEPVDARLKVGYVVSHFPKTTETFIAREALAVSELGPEVSMVSITREADEIVQPGVEKLLPSLIAGTDATVPGVVISQLRWLARRPSRLIRMWWRGLTANIRSAKFLSRAVIICGIAPWMADRITSRGLQHLHAHWGSHSALLAHQVAALTDLPYTVTLHAHDLHINRYMLGEKLAAASSVVTISDHNRDLLAELYPDLRSVEVVHCGVDVSAIEPRPAEPVNDPPRIGVVAGLREFKGHHHLLEAQRILNARGRAIVLDLVGDGPLRSELEAEAGDDVVFHGAVSVEQALKIVGECDVAVLPSVVLANGRRDGIPVALIEAMALGVPVVSTRVSGIPELVEHEVTGLLVEQRDPAGLADAIERLLDDPELRRRMGRAGRRHVEEQFDLSRSAQQMVDCFLSTGGAHE